MTKKVNLQIKSNFKEFKFNSHMQSVPGALEKTDLQHIVVTYTINVQYSTRVHSVSVVCREPFGVTSADARKTL